MENDIVARLRNKHADDLLAWEAADEIERLRKERDEARRMYLREVCAGFPDTEATEAAMRGWDCCTNVAARPCPKSKGA